MRIPAASTTLVIVALAAQTALVCAPASASADGFEKGLRCHYNGPESILPPKVSFTTVPGRPYTPPTGEFTDSEPWPTSNFSATVNWGDGTTSPATIRSQEGCDTTYEASAPSHTYSAPGTYLFSYTIHDVSTGLDHTVGSETFYVLTSLPAPIPGPAPAVVHAKVGEPWSGVVGEFQMNLVAGIPLSAYSASIEWGDGQTSPGIVATAAIFPRFTVSGSHTYSQPLSAPIKVSINGGIETGNWTTANAMAALPPQTFKFVGQLILAAVANAKRSTAYELIFRLDHPLPRTKSGHIEASLSGYGVAGSLASFGPHKRRACYAAGVEIPKRHAPKTHHRYPFTLSVTQPQAMQTRGNATLHRYFNFVSMLTGATKKLAC